MVIELVNHLYTALEMAVQGQSELKNQQVIKDLGSLIYRLAPSPETTKTLEFFYEKAGIIGNAGANTLMMSSSSGQTTATQNAGLKVFSLTSNQPSQTKKNRQVVVADEKPFDEELNDVRDSETDEEHQMRMELYASLLAMDEDQFIKHFVSLKMAKVFADSLGIAVPKTAGRSETVALIQQHLANLI